MTIGWHTLAPFLVAVLVLQVTPGPGMLFILANGISGGPRAGVAPAFGAASGMVVHTIAAAAGLAALFGAAPPVYDAVRLAGAAYLLWLAIGHFRRPTLATEGSAEATPGRRVFARALLNNLANPKVVVFFVAFLPQFIVPGGAARPVQLLFLGALFLVVGLMLDVCIGLFAGRVGQALRTRTWISRLLDRLAGSILAALGLRLALDTERP